MNLMSLMSLGCVFCVLAEFGDAFDEVARDACERSCIFAARDAGA